MVRSRHSALVRAFAVLCLVWVGFDIGAHGLFASDFTPIAPISASLHVRVDERGATAPGAPDHCFCHSVSMGAVRPAPTAGLTPAGALVLDLSPQVPRSDPHPLDRPPQLAA
jgi:hypothetical protein